ncbi:MAG: RHS repeat-associated core domain-containing protein [Vicinamibacteria bacterium]|nr:RHS repeat-associated core domain-containing protein [Vicinamibacteria bacterium]
MKNYPRVDDSTVPSMKRLLLCGLLLAGLPGLSPAQGVKVEYAHLDGIGNVIAVSNSAGVEIESHDYLPFGEEWCGTSVCGSVKAGQSRRFTGKERDAETGLDYFGARYFASKVGRFTTVDPLMTIPANLANPQRWNRYSYGLNNPLRYIDPDGRDVSIALQFTGEWKQEDRAAIIGKVTSWYKDLGVGAAYVFDAANAKHGSVFSGVILGYANVEVLDSAPPGNKHVSDKVYAGGYAGLTGEERLNAIANSIVHETAVHQFGGPYGYSLPGDQIAYSRTGVYSGDPEARKRRGSVADSYAYGDPATRSKVTGGPIPVNASDRAELLRRVGPNQTLAAPVKR